MLETLRHSILICIADPTCKLITTLSTLRAQCKFGLWFQESWILVNFENLCSYTKFKIGHMEEN